MEICAMPQLRQRLGTEPTAAPAPNSSYSSVSVSVSLALALTLVPKWRVDALPNWLPRPKANANACKRPNYIKSCINHERRPPAPLPWPRVLSSAAWPRPIWQQSFVPSAESCPSSRADMFYTYAEIFSLRWRMNFYLAATMPLNTHRKLK